MLTESARCHLSSHIEHDWQHQLGGDWGIERGRPSQLTRGSGKRPTQTSVYRPNSHDGHKPWPWRPQQWKREKLTPLVQLYAYLNLTSLDKFHQVGGHGLWPSLSKPVCNSLHECCLVCVSELSVGLSPNVNTLTCVFYDDSLNPALCVLYCCVLCLTLCLCCCSGSD